MRTHILLALCSAYCLGISSLSAAPVLVGNASYGSQTLSADEAKAVLTGKKVTIGDTRVVIVIAKSGENQDALLQSVTGMNGSQLQNLWRRLFMTGGGSAPKIAADEAEAAKLVAENPGAIAVIDAALANGLTVLLAP